MSRPRISVILPTFSRPAQLSACLGALAAQSAGSPPFEVIVVDDGGSPPAAPVVEAFARQLNLRLIRQTNSGPAEARNAGARLARGRWLAFTDDDCLPEPGWLGALDEAFQEHPEALLGGATRNALYGNAYSAGSQLIQDFVYAYYNADPARARFFASNNLALPAEGFAALGGFNAAFRTSEDRDLCDRWQAASRPMRLVEAAVVRHAHHLTLAGYWRQHLGYGRGARLFQLAHTARGGRSSIEPAFYISILQHLPGELTRHRRPLAMTALLALWQAANLAGWLHEMLQSKRIHASR